MKELLENHFQTVYGEYKEYETFVREIAPKIKTEREEFDKYLQKNLDDVEGAVDRLFDINSKPALYQNDLVNLQSRLIHTYETLKETVEIPVEIKTEIESFKKPKQTYKIEKGNPVEIDEKATEEFKKTVRANYRDIVKASIENLKRG